MKQPEQQQLTPGNDEFKSVESNQHHHHRNQSNEESYFTSQSHIKEFTSSSGTKDQLFKDFQPYQEDDQKQKYNTARGEQNTKQAKTDVMNLKLNQRKDSDNTSEHSHLTHEDKSDKDGDNLSQYSLNKDHNNKIFIAKNHIKLNILINLFVIVCLCIIFSLNWFCFDQYSNKQKIGDAVCFKLMSTYVPDLGRINIKQFVNLDCPTLSKYLPFRENICLEFISLYDGFLLVFSFSCLIIFQYVILKTIGCLLNFHSILSLAFMISDKTYDHKTPKNTGKDQNYNTFQLDEKAGRMKHNKDDEEYTPLKNKDEQTKNKHNNNNDKTKTPVKEGDEDMTPQNMYQDFEDRDQPSIINKFEGTLFQAKSKIDQYLTTHTLKWAIFLNFMAISSWILLVTIVYGYQYLSISPFLDLIYCFALLGIKIHQQKWEHRLLIAKYIREYI